eukprot:760721-Hanusia_phi.AAC.1
MDLHVVHGISYPKKISDESEYGATFIHFLFLKSSIQHRSHLRKDRNPVCNLRELHGIPTQRHLQWGQVRRRQSAGLPGAYETAVESDRTVSVDTSSRVHIPRRISCPHFIDFASWQLHNTGRFPCIYSMVVPRLPP